MRLGSSLLPSGGSVIERERLEGQSLSQSVGRSVCGGKVGLRRCGEGPRTRTEEGPEQGLRKDLNRD